MPRLVELNHDVAGHFEVRYRGFNLGRRGNIAMISLSRTIPDQPRRAVKVRVVAGNVLKPVLAHQGDDQGIVCEQASLPADHCGRRDQVRANGQHLYLVARDLFDRLPEHVQLLNFRGMVRSRCAMPG